MAQVVVYGNGQVAGLAHYYLSHDSPHDVVAFTVESQFLSEDTLMGVPVVPFDTVLDTFPPEQYRMFVAMGYARVNRDREVRYQEVKRLGYECITYVSSKAIVWPGVVVGENCFIMEATVLQPFVTVGNDVVIWSACHIGHESVIRDHCFLSAHAVVAGNVVVEENCFLGVNTTVRNSITIGRGSVIGAGAVIMKSTEALGVYLAPKPELLAMASDRLPGL